MKNIPVVFVLALLLITISNDVQGQAPTLSADEINSLKELAKTGNWAWIGINAFSAIIGGIITWFGLRKKVEDWAEKEITKKANEKFGVDWAIVKLLLDEKKQEMEQQGTKFAIIGSKGKYKELQQEMTKNGLKTHDYREHAQLPETTEINSIDVLVIDNADGNYAEQQVVHFLDKMVGRVPLVYLSDANGLSSENFQRFKSQVMIIKLMDRLGETIIKAKAKG